MTEIIKPELTEINDLSDLEKFISSVQTMYEPIFRYAATPEPTEAATLPVSGTIEVAI